MICTDDTRRVWCAPGVCSPPPSLCVRVRRALDRVPIVQSRVARRASRHRPCDVLSLHVPSCAVLHTAPRRAFCVHAPRLRRSALERDPRTVLDPSSVMCAAGEREVWLPCAGVSGDTRSPRRVARPRTAASSDRGRARARRSRAVPRAGRSGTSSHERLPPPSGIRFVPGVLVVEMLRGDVAYASLSYLLPSHQNEIEPYHYPLRIAVSHAPPGWFAAKAIRRPRRASPCGMRASRRRPSRSRRRVARWRADAVWSPSEVGFIAPTNLRSRPGCTAGAGRQDPGDPRRGPTAYRRTGTAAPASRRVAGSASQPQRFEASVLRRPLRCICATPGLLTPAILHSQAPFTRAPPTSPQCHLGAS